MIKERKVLILLIFLLCILHIPAKTDIRRTINIGESQWLFKKIENKAPINIDTILLKNKNGREITFKSKDFEYPLSLKIKFNHTNIHRIFYSIMGYNNKWENIIIRHGYGVDLKYENIEEIDKKGNTVGVVKKKNISYTNESLIHKYDSIKIIIDSLSYSDSIKIKNILTSIDIKKRTKSTVKDESSLTYDDSDWEIVGLPHCYNDDDTYLNSYRMNMWRGEVWYRKKIKIPNNNDNKRYILEFQGITTGCAIYINGDLIPCHSSIKHPDEVTHVGSFLPFSIDITEKLKWNSDNIIAIRVSNEFDGFFTNPGIGTYEGFCMGLGGIVAPVHLHILPPIYIPDNPMIDNKWGTYIGCKHIAKNNAYVVSNINIYNSTDKDETVIAKTIFEDHKGNQVLVLQQKGVVLANAYKSFQMNGIINKPYLWYSNGSKLGKPYLYNVKTQIVKSGIIIDEKTEKIGLRELTWDKDYLYVNGEKTILKGFGYRNSYPGLGSAVPDIIQWNDAQLIAQCGGNTLRVGHIPTTKSMTMACDALGILIIQNSGDNEWTLKDEPITTYKKEFDKNMILAYRNNPSICIWESNNGLPTDSEKIYHPINTYNISKEYDFIQPRITLSRDFYPNQWPDSLNIVIGYTNNFIKCPSNPSINTEVYGAYWDGRRSWNAARFDYENELPFTMYYINDYLYNIKNKACGWIDWMLTETQGEGYTIYLNGKKRQKSLGSSAMDGNRFPKLKYNVYKNALWNEFKDKPGIILNSVFVSNKPQTIKAFTNCPFSELFVNNQSLGIKKTDSLKCCTWDNVLWSCGQISINGLDSIKKTIVTNKRNEFGEPYKLEIEITSNKYRDLGGKRFTAKANGSDVTIATIKIVDKNGVLCENASNLLEFEVTGDVEFRGSYNFYIQEDGNEFEFAPKSKKLRAEGGLMRIAIKSKFTSGKAFIRVKSKALIPAEKSFIINKLNRIKL